MRIQSSTCVANTGHHNKQITARTLILKADAKDDVKNQNEAAASLLTRGKLVHVTGARHNVRRDQKERLLVALQAFLSEL